MANPSTPDPDAGMRKKWVDELASSWRPGLINADPNKLSHLLEHPALLTAGSNISYRKIELIRLCEQALSSEMPRVNAGLAKLSAMLLGLAEYQNVDQQTRYRAAVRLVKEWNGITEENDTIPYREYWDNPVRKREGRQAMGMLLQHLDAYAQPRPGPQEEDGRDGNRQTELRAHEAVRSHLPMRDLFASNPGAASWLAIFSMFAREPIPIEPLEIGAQSELPNVLGRLDEHSVRWYVNWLDVAGLVDRLPGDFFTVPRSTSRETLNYTDDETSKAALRAAILLLDESFPIDGEDERKWHISEPLAPHVLAVASLAEESSLGRRAAPPLLARVSAFYRSRAEFDKAIDVGRRAVAIAERVYGRESPRIVNPLVTLAHVLMDAGEHVESEQLFRRAIELESTEVAAERAATINLLGNVFRHMGRFSDAETEQRRALALFSDDNRGEAYARVANDLALTLEYEDRTEAALPLYRSALAEIGEADRANNIKMNIGRTLLSLGRLREAQEALEQAESDQLAMNVPNPGLLWHTLDFLEMVYRQLGDETLARETAQRKAQIRRPWV